MPASVWHGRNSMRSATFRSPLRRFQVGPAAACGARSPLRPPAPLDVLAQRDARERRARTGPALPLSVPSCNGWNRDGAGHMDAVMNAPTAGRGTTDRVEEREPAPTTFVLRRVFA